MKLEYELRELEKVDRDVARCDELIRDQFEVCKKMVSHGDGNGVDAARKLLETLQKSRMVLIEHKAVILSSIDAIRKTRSDDGCSKKNVDL